MAVLRVESFDWMDVGMTNANIVTALQRKGLISHNLTSTDAEMVAGIGGKGSALRMRETDQFARFDLVGGHISAATDEVGCGGWFRFNQVSSNNNWADQDFMGMVDSNGTQFQMNLRTVNGQVAVYRSTGFWQYTGFYPEPGQWYFMAIKTVINDTTGSYAVEIDGVEYLNETSIDTRSGGNGVFQYVQFGGTANGNNGFDIAGFIVWDDQGGDLTDFPAHPVSFVSIHPDGDGDDEDWSTSSGSDSYVLVNETAPHDDDSDYIEDSTSTNRTLFTYDNVSTNFTGIVAIQLNTVVRETDATDFTLVNTLKSGGTLYPESAEAIAGQTYETIYHVYDEDPDTSAAWTVTNLNALQAGVETG